LNKKKINRKLKKETKFFIKNGYLIIKNCISKKIVDKTLNDFKKIVSSESFKKNPDYFHYNKSPRVIEGWKKSKNIKNICFNKKILKYLNLFYNKKPMPISTINFTLGTEQPLHSDYIHFGTVPEKFLAGAWVAFEKVGKDNGPLQIVPGSHKTRIVNFYDLNLKIPKTTKELKKNYTIYENYLKELINIKKLKKKNIYMNKGDALIWAANLFHGGTKIKNQKKTRFSQVVHYHFKDLDYIYNPCFTDRNLGIIAKRDINEILVK
jgi:ectoine hydroxylase-related dioxygenase (phytanoyl-CoA dioxygenase family)